MVTATDPVDIYLTQLAETVQNMSREQVWAVIHALLDAWRDGRRVFILGNGGSASTASHMVNDLNKLTITPGKPRFKAMCLADNVPLMTAWGNDTTYENVFVEPMLNFLEAGDVVVGISASGNSPNVVKALRVAHEHGAVTVAFTGCKGGKCLDLADYCIPIPSEHLGHQEDAHLILDHVIANTLKQLIASEP